MKTVQITKEIIEAMAADRTEKIPELILSHRKDIDSFWTQNPHLMVRTLKGDKRANVGDWLAAKDTGFLSVIRRGMNMLTEEIEEHGKQLHQFAEMFEIACKTGDGFEASVVVGRIIQVIPELRVLAKTINEASQPYNNRHEAEFNPPRTVDVN
jgi:hypothetical protein